MSEVYDLIVIGAGPGGYGSAFFAADKGLKVALVEAGHLGGTCLNVGCIPSKALLHVTHVMEESEAVKEAGVTFSKPKVDLDKLRAYKDKVVSQLRGGVGSLAKARKVDVLVGFGSFIDKNTLLVKGETEQKVQFKHAIIATGSSPVMPKMFDIGSKNVIDSTGALELESIPKRFLVIGGGVIGLELGSVYAALGSEVTVVEALPELINGMDRDIVRPLEKRIKDSFKAVHVNTKVLSLEEKGKKGILAKYEGPKDVEEGTFDKVLLCIGRKPTSQNLGLDNVGIETDERGFIKVTRAVHTSCDNIFAIGDVVGNPMLAHKATREGKIAVEKILGMKSEFDNLVIPAVIYTDPEVAWAGVTENEAKEKGLKVNVGKFPWAASGRALSMGKTNGLTKIITDAETEKIIGISVVGSEAGELITEGVLAIEMGAVLEDLTNTIHAHPTLSESVFEAAEAVHGLSTHLFSPKKK